MKLEDMTLDEFQNLMERWGNDFFFLEFIVKMMMKNYIQILHMRPLVIQSVRIVKRDIRLIHI